MYFLDVWLTIVKKYNTEGTKHERLHVKYLQQEEYDCVVRVVQDA